MTVLTEKAVLDAPVERVWEVLSATHRYAEWVAVVREVTDHHGEATVGRTYSERNVLLGPLTTRTTWTVLEVVPMSRRVDAGVGFPLVQDLRSAFLLRPVPEGTELTYEVTYGFPFGRIGGVLDKAQQGGQRHAMRQSLTNLAELLRSEA
ncbi:MAG TPA: SRPBCC family protein [Mycobacteriales bacterium]|nr:SRPBCC family protein [Mycobacteriales bacterium]